MSRKNKMTEARQEYLKGLAFQRGHGEYTRDSDKAIEHYIKAVEFGSENAARNLLQMSAQGLDIGPEARDAIHRHFPGLVPDEPHSGSGNIPGQRLEEIILEYLLSDFQRASGVDLRQDELAMSRLKEAVEGARHELERNGSAHVTVPFVTFKDGPLDLNVTVDRSTLRAYMGLGSTPREPAKKPGDEEPPRAPVGAGGGTAGATDLEETANHWRQEAKRGSRVALSRLRELMNSGIPLPADLELSLIPGADELLSEMGLERGPTTPLRLWGDSEEADRTCSPAVRAFLDKDYSAAKEAAVRGALHRYSECLNILGALYEAGQGGLPKDQRKAYICFILARGEERKNPVAYFNQGRMIYYQKPGLGEPVTDAYPYFVEAANLGYAKAHAALGEMYDLGIGRHWDRKKAREHYKTALEMGELEDMEEWVRERLKELGGPAGKPEETNAGASFLSELDELIGLHEVKEQVRRLVSLALYQGARRTHGYPAEPPDLHIVFTGAPGTGKTTVARILSSIYAELGFLSTGELHEVTSSDLVAEYLGQSAPKTKKVVEAAFGGTLFIDEAYALSPKGLRYRDQYGTRVIATLVKMMEDYRDRFALIVAGYADEMDSFIRDNPGLRSRFRQHIHFPDYTPEELIRILGLMLRKEQLEIEPDALKYVSDYLQTVFPHRDKRTWGNAREVRNILKTAVEHRAYNLFGRGGGEVSAEQLRRLTIADFGFLRHRTVDSTQRKLLNDSGREIASFKDLEKRAEAGDVASQLLLAHFVMEGYGGTERDFERAKALFSKAEAAGSAEAARELGRMRELGLLGEPDPEGARELYRRAVEGGDALAVQYLELMERGEEQPVEAGSGQGKSSVTSAGTARA